MRVSACTVALVTALSLGCSTPQDPPAPAPAGASLDDVEQLADRADDAALEELLAIAQDDQADGSVRFAAISALGRSSDETVVEPLVALLQADLEQRTGLWSAAIPALGELGDARAFEVLVRCLEDRSEDWLGRDIAATALGMLGDRRAAAPLTVALGYADTRDSALAALHELGVELSEDLAAELAGTR